MCITFIINYKDFLKKDAKNLLTRIKDYKNWSDKAKILLVTSKSKIRHT